MFTLRARLCAIREEIIDNNTANRLSSTKPEGTGDYYISNAFRQRIDILISSSTPVLVPQSGHLGGIETNAITTLRADIAKMSDSDGYSDFGASPVPVVVR